MLWERLGSLSLEQKTRLLTGADFWSLYAEPAVGLRRIVLSDGPAGVRGGLWDEAGPVGRRPVADRARGQLGRGPGGAPGPAAGRRKGVDVLLAPTVNLHRSPMAAATSSASARTRC